MKIKLAQIALASAMMASPFCVVQAEELQNSVSFFGMLMSPDTGDSTATVRVAYERAIDQNLKFGFNYQIMGSPQDTSTTVEGFGAYYFAPIGKQGSVAPYLKAGLSVTGSDYIDTTTGTMIGAGLEFAISERVAMPIEIVKQSYSSDSGSDFGYTMTSIGLKMYF